MILHVIYVVAAVLLLFGASIFVHELGHFLAARALGLVVEVFSIGFGPALWSWKHRGVRYKIGVFPVGGYVALPQIDPSEPRPAPGPDRAASPPAPPPAPPWKKIVVTAAGAAGNFVLAVALAWIVYGLGKPTTPGERSAVIGYVEPGSPAYDVGLRPGDAVAAVNGEPVRTWSDLFQEAARAETADVEIAAPDGPRLVRVPTAKNALGFRMIEGLREVSLCTVQAVEPGSGAAQAGLLPGDMIRRFADQTVYSIEHLIALVGARPDQPTPAVIERDGQMLDLELTPRLDAALGRARIGIRFDPAAVDYDQVEHIPPGVQLRRHAGAILRVVRSLVTPGEAGATSQGLGGPPMILYMIQDAVRKGLAIALSFMCFLNVNLAILNLMPIPVLDGGHILFALWEGITRRRLPPKVVGWIHQVFFALFIAAILWLSGRDLKRLYTLRQLSRPAPAPEAAPAGERAPE